MSEDPKLFAAGDNNFFRYCGNDPEDRTDPMGLSDAILKAQYDPNYIGGAGNGQFDKMQSMGAITVAAISARHVEQRATGDVFHDREGNARALPVSNTIGVAGAGKNTAGNSDLVKLVNAMGGTTVYRDYFGRTVQQLMGMGYHSATGVGYSLGGLAMINTARRFSSFTFNMIGIDVVRGGMKGGSITLPSNVASASNYYQQNPHNWFDGKHNPFIGTPLSSPYIPVGNHNWTGGSTHG